MEMEAQHVAFMLADARKLVEYIERGRTRLIADHMRKMYHTYCGTDSPFVELSTCPFATCRTESTTAPKRTQSAAVEGGCTQPPKRQRCAEEQRISSYVPCNASNRMMNIIRYHLHLLRGTVDYKHAGRVEWLRVFRSSTLDPSVAIEMYGFSRMTKSQLKREIRSISRLDQYLCSRIVPHLIALGLVDEETVRSMVYEGDLDPLFFDAANISQFMTSCRASMAFRWIHVPPLALAVRHNWAQHIVMSVHTSSHYSMRLCVAMVHAMDRTEVGAAIQVVEQGVDRACATIGFYAHLSLYVLYRAAQASPSEAFKRKYIDSKLWDMMQDAFNT